MGEAGEAGQVKSRSIRCVFVCARRSSNGWCQVSGQLMESGGGVRNRRRKRGLGVCVCARRERSRRGGNKKGPLVVVATYLPTSCRPGSLVQAQAQAHAGWLRLAGWLARLDLRDGWRVYCAYAGGGASC